MNHSEWKLRIINLDQIAKRFSEKQKANTIIISNSCRIKLSSYTQWYDQIYEEDVAHFQIRSLREIFPN
jgi:hypothetical protein